MKKITLMCCALLMTALSVFAQRVVGYVPSYGNKNVIQYDKLTDIVYGFAELHTDGSITLPLGFVDVVNKAKSNAVKVHLSVGGDGASSSFPAVSASVDARNKLATQLAKVVSDYDLAGVDIDWEFPASSKSWQLAQMLKAIKEKIGTGKELSIAIPALQYNAGAYTSQSDPYVDFYHLMAYDNTSEQNHSSYAFAQQSVNYWSSSKGFAKSKFRLGLPFYGRPNWGGTASAYSSISASTPSTVYNSDSYNGWQYNGKTTIKNKCNYALNQGLNGVLIWELTQDRTDQYSLMNAVNEVMDAGVVCSEPKLGFTKSLCGVPSVTLDADVSGTNFSYQWSKDGTSLSGQTSKTYSATTVGNYCVDYKHTVTTGQICPTKTACVDVQDAVAVEVENVTICDGGEVTLKVLTPGAYKWFTTPNGGTSVYSGEEYTLNVNTSKTYYVEKPAVSEIVGKTVADLPVNDAGTGDAVDYDKAKIIFDALTEFTLDYVTVYYYADKAGDAFTVTIYDSEGKVVGTSTPFSPAAVKDQRIPVGITIPAGTGYQLAVTGAPVWVQKGPWGETTGFPYTKEGIISITGTKHDDIDDPIVHWYPGICNWEVSAGASCGRTAISATVKTNCKVPVVSFTKPSSTVITNGSSPVELEIMATDADGTIESVTFLIKKDGEDYATITGTTGVGTDKYVAEWIATEIGTYTIEVIVIDNDLNEVKEENVNTIEVSEITNVIKLVDNEIALYPNPFTKQFVIDLGTIENANIVVYDVQGQVVVTFNNVNGVLELGTELSSGIYTLQVITEGNVISSKIVKQ